MARTPVKTRPPAGGAETVQSGTARAAVNGSAPANGFDAATARRVKTRKANRRFAWSRLMRVGYGVAAVAMMTLVLIFVVGLLLYSGEARNSADKARKADAIAAAKPMPTATPDRSGVLAKPIEPEALQQVIASNSALILDARPTNDYLQGHIEGTQSMPHYHMVGQAATLPKDRPVITICDQATCPGGEEAARLLIIKGVDNVGYLKGGIEGWRAKGLPLVQSAQ